MTINRKTLLSWEFITFVLVTAGAWLAEIQGTFSGMQAIYLSAAAAAVTALSRGFAKQGADVKNWWMTTEFYVTVIGAAQVFIGQLNGTISSQSMTVVASALAGALALARGIGKNPLVAAGLVDASPSAPTAIVASGGADAKVATPAAKK